MPAKLLILPLLGGFAFISLYIYLSTATSKLSGERLIFWAALAGVGLTIASRLFVLLVNWLLPGVGAYWQSHIFPDPYTGTATLALAIGLVSPFLFNRFVSKEDAVSWSIERFGNSMDSLIKRAVDNEFQIQITTKHNKVYVGHVLRQPEHVDQTSYLKIFPLTSGYRDQETKKVIFEVDYWPLYEKLWGPDSVGPTELEGEDFEKVVPVSNILLISIFDPAIYEYCNCREPTAEKL